MLRPRLYDARISGLPEAIGLCASDFTRIAAAVNEAQERLINDPLAPDDGWWGGWARYAFNVTQADSTIVTPQEVSRVILMDVCKAPVIIRNSFYEFLAYGRGWQPEGCCNTTTQCGQKLAAYERETVVTAQDLASTAQTIRVYIADSNDVDRACYIAGKDANDKVIYYTDGLTGEAGQGERIQFASPFTDSANTFTEITGIQKAKTFGEVQFFQVDPTTGAESPLLVMAPGETTAQYRKYFINGLEKYCCASATQQVLAMCKLDYIPAVVDTDYLCITSVPALIDECMSIRYGRMDSAQAQSVAEKKHLSALRLLFGQLDNYLGKERTAIRRSIFGSDPMRTQPV